ncbi:hypothetical protein BFJ63_vAg17859 [Fusarium oxysporum f. sp. narcissi]|uniref:Alpha/beta hydrolase fold-3 domain-containing protein n=1 Tax=Fusarium oxysporum f. sp. narcissi TaxID=451672 RepID=A0A4Q2UYT8_FUSOX|nr:hypothetical protein BFJ63_vAg17859 [Fusarium oxysporum f. sp. narcissi]
MSSIKCESFHEFEESYKTVNDCEIKASLFVPKQISKKVLPILVHFHGGGLVMGDKNYFPWWATWLVQLAEKHEAVIVSPNYRLIPEATVSDVLQDLESFWTWLPEYLPSQVRMKFGNVRLDMQNILVAGESAGGYLALQSAFLYPDAGISAAICQYGTMLFNPEFVLKPCTEEEAEIVPEQLVDEHLQSIKPGAVRSSSVGDDALRLSAAFVQHGRYDGFLGENPYIFLEAAEKYAAVVPPIWLIQGTEDSTVSLWHMFITKQVLTAKGAGRIVPSAHRLFEPTYTADKSMLQSRTRRPWIRPSSDTEHGVGEGGS